MVRYLTVVTSSNIVLHALTSCWCCCGGCSTGIRTLRLEGGENRSGVIHLRIDSAVGQLHAAVLITVGGGVLHVWRSLSSQQQSAVPQPRVPCVRRADHNTTINNGDLITSKYPIIVHYKCFDGVI